MTALRPERDTGAASGAGPQGSPYGAGQQQRWYGDGAAQGAHDGTAVLPPYADDTAVLPPYAQDNTGSTDSTALLPPYAADGTAPLPPYGTPPGSAGGPPYGGPGSGVPGPAAHGRAAEYPDPAGYTGAGHGGSPRRDAPAAYGGPLPAEQQAVSPGGAPGAPGNAMPFDPSAAYDTSAAYGAHGVPGAADAAYGARRGGPAAGGAPRSRPARHGRPVDGPPESPVNAHVRAPDGTPGAPEAPGTAGTSTAAGESLRTAGGSDETMALGPSAVAEARRRAAVVGGTPVGTRAERRKAAKRHGRRPGHGTAGQPVASRDGGGEGEGAAPRSRVESRRAARARRPGPAVVVSRAVGELFITAGVLMLLFVTYQLWWSNVRAHKEAGSAAKHLQQDWASGKRAPGEFEPGQGFAILHIPRLDVVAPIAEGTSKTNVLDKGMVGHYGEGTLKTAMPDAKTGNFGLAAHRNTHGEPFRYINRLKPGDPIVVETQDTYFVYKMASVLPVTSPSNTAVLDPVPAGSGFTGPGRYITLTTCTPEFTSKYRLVVWGKMVEERPRGDGKPDALVQ
ncbi:sortase A [Streptomyces sp. B3I8]|nr:sortase A [Streptomyces sp. B3I8]